MSIEWGKSAQKGIKTTKSGIKIQAFFEIPLTTRHSFNIINI
jgi:hypothetical protein